jgi:hypothetical protein
VQATADLGFLLLGLENGSVLLFATREQSVDSPVAVLSLSACSSGSRIQLLENIVELHPQPSSNCFALVFPMVCEDR